MIEITIAQCKGMRAMLGWSQGEAARRARITRGTISEFERGIREVSLRTKHALLEAFGKEGITVTASGGICYKD